jgi:beta-glucosidase
MSPTDRAELSVSTLVAQMTLEEKCAMVTGITPWIVGGVERLGIPEWAVADGPVGVRGRTMGPGLVVPGASALAATWDPEVVRTVGTAIGEECLDKNVDMILGPTVNVHRSPRGGRHFESFSEDPLLSSAMAVAYIEGVQSTGVGACIKHFVCNDQETDRMTVNVTVDERALREIYLPAFEAGVRRAGVRSVMASYNYVNGEHANASRTILLDLLKGEWGFDGFVVSDWGAMKDTLGPALGGLDLEMGSDDKFSSGRLLAAVESGAVPESVVDDKVRRLLGFLEWRGRLQGTTDHTEAPREHPEHRTVVRRAAADGMVLVRNDGTLPLASGASLALVGPGASDTALMGGGSASLDMYRSTTVADVIEARWKGVVRHAPGVSLKRRADPVPAGWLSGPVTVDFHAGPDVSAPIAVSIEQESPEGSWHSMNWPVPEAPVLSARIRFAVVLPTTGRYRVMVGGYGHSQALLDGVVVADNHMPGSIHPSLGVLAGVADLDLAKGRHEFVLEHSANPPRPLILARFGLELLPGSDEQMLVEAAAAARASDVAVVVVGTSGEWETEGQDRTSLVLPKNQDDLVRRVAAANPRTVVVLNSGAPVAMPWLDDVAAVLIAWYPGQEGADAIVDVLTGRVGPGGRMPTTWAADERDTPTYPTFPGEAQQITYGEGIYVGYRWYDARAISPMIPFGHGLAYASFEWGDPAVCETDSGWTITVPISSSSARGGSEVIQVYAAPPVSPVHRPVKTLVGFAKVHLGGGETATATIEVQRQALARWDLASHGWIIDSGPYELLVAASATDIRSTVTITV